MKEVLVAIYFIVAAIMFGYLHETGEPNILMWIWPFIPLVELGVKIAKWRRNK